MKRYLYIPAIVIPLVLIFSSYSNTFFSPPYLDDFHSIVDEPAFDSSQWSIAQLLQVRETKFGLRRWIPMITFTWDATIGGKQLPSYHLTNLAIHMVCFIAVLMLWFVLLRHTQRTDSSSDPALPPFEIALWSAVLWALHPVQTNAVTYIVQRMASLVTLFSVLCIALYAAGRARSIRKGAVDSQCVLLFIGSFLSLILSLFSKENSLMNPVLLLITETWFFRRDTPMRIYRFAKRHWFLSVGVVALFAVAGFHVLPPLLTGYEHRHFTMSQRVLTELRVIVWYVSILLWPSPNRLSMEHDIDISTSLIHPVSTLLSLVLLAVSIFFTILRRKRNPLVTFGILWFLINLVIESSIIPLELVFEHRLYLPSIGIIFVIVVVIYSLLKKIFVRASSNDFRKLAWCAVTIVASVLSLLTFQRNELWRDPITINRDNVAKAPMNNRAHANLAVALLKIGQAEEAIKESYTALALGKGRSESFAEAANAIVLAYFQLGEYQQAADEGKRLLADWPSGSGAIALPFLCLSTALANKELGNLSAAYELVVKALWFDQRLSWRIPRTAQVATGMLQELLQLNSSQQIDLNGDGQADPGAVGARVWIAQLLLQYGLEPEASALLRLEIQKNPEATVAHDILRRLQDETARSQIQAKEWSFWQKFVRHPFSRFNFNMAVAYLIQAKQLPAFLWDIGDFFLDSALMLDQNSADAHLLKGWYHFKRKRVADAVAEAERALLINPEYAKAWLGLAFFLAGADRPQEAVAAFQKTLELYPRCPDALAITSIMRGLQENLPGSNPPLPSP